LIRNSLSFVSWKDREPILPFCEVSEVRTAGVKRSKFAHVEFFAFLNPEQTLGGEAEHLGTSQAVNNRSAA